MADPFNYSGPGGFDPDCYQVDDAANAAIYVGVMVATAAIFLALLKKSGFRAMIAVGKG